MPTIRTISWSKGANTGATGIFTTTVPEGSILNQNVFVSTTSTACDTSDTGASRGANVSISPSISGTTLKISVSVYINTGGGSGTASGKIYILE